MSPGFNRKSTFCNFLFTEKLLAASNDAGGGQDLKGWAWISPWQKVKESEMGAEISFQNKAGSAWRDQSWVLWHKDKTRRD